MRSFSIVWLLKRDTWQPWGKGMAITFKWTRRLSRILVPVLFSFKDLLLHNLCNLCRCHFALHWSCFKFLFGSSFHQVLNPGVFHVCWFHVSRFPPPRIFPSCSENFKYIKFSEDLSLWLSVASSSGKKLNYSGIIRVLSCIHDQRYKAKNKNFTLILWQFARMTSVTSWQSCHISVIWWTAMLENIITV